MIIESITQCTLPTVFEFQQLVMYKTWGDVVYMLDSSYTICKILLAASKKDITLNAKEIVYAIGLASAVQDSICASSELTS